LNSSSIRHTHTHARKFIIASSFEKTKPQEKQRRKKKGLQPIASVFLSSVLPVGNKRNGSEFNALAPSRAPRRVGGWGPSRRIAHGDCLCHRKIGRTDSDPGGENAEKKTKKNHKRGRHAVKQKAADADGMDGMCVGRVYIEYMDSLCSWYRYTRTYVVFCTAWSGAAGTGRKKALFFYLLQTGSQALHPR